MLKIGITGSIGSGKTTVCRIFQTLGVPVYYADERGKYLLQHDPVVRSMLIASFGDNIFDLQGLLKRKDLAEIVFENPGRLSVLEGIVFPAVQNDFLHWAKDQNAPYILKEAALLLEAGTHTGLDRLITVTAPLETRLERVLKRDQISRAQIMARIARQWSDEKKVEAADFVLYNNDHQLLLPQVLNLHRKLLETANKIPA